MQTVTMDLRVDGPEWPQAVRDNGFPLEAKLGHLTAGRRTISLWRVNNNMLVQKLVLYTGELLASYLGPTPKS